MGNVLQTITDTLGGDGRQGEARQPQSLWGMINTLLPMIIIASVYLVIFLITRRSQKRFYAPKAYLGSIPEYQRSPTLPDSMLRWVGTFWSIPDIYALRHTGLDAYLFLRYLRVSTLICFVSICITWPILLPLHATGGNGKSQLELISYSNIDIEKNSQRLYAHALLAWVVYSFVMYMVTRECIFYINLRQAFLLSAQSANLVSSRTVLYTKVPEHYRDESRIRQLFGDSVKNVSVAGDSSEVENAVARRDRVAMMLEKAEVKLIKKVNKHRFSRYKTAPTGAVSSQTNYEFASDSQDAASGNNRPSHRLGFLGLFGTKVDTIEWSRSELERLIPEAERAQNVWKSGGYEKAPAIFVEFQSQCDAHAAYRAVTHHQALSLTPNSIGIRPDEVIWSNLAIPWWQLFIRQYAIFAFIGFLTIFWAIPVAAVGFVSQISLIQSLPGLTWIASIPSQIRGVISGLLPAAALSLLMSLVPIIMRFCAKLTGIVSLPQVELWTQNAFFFFQLIQVFLIRTITDTAFSALINIVQNPTSVFATLAEALPTSSNFYISYFIFEGLMIAVDVMTQVVGCVFFSVVYRWFTRNPRAMFKKWTKLNAESWASELPVYTGMVVISVTYAVVAPILLLWATLGILIFYQAYRYNIIFVSETEIDTHGLIYPRALKQLFAGLYMAEVCLIGLFAVSKALGQLALIIILLVFTILYHISLNRALDPLLYNLPRTLYVDEQRHQAHVSSYEDASATEDGLGVQPVLAVQESIETKKTLSWGIGGKLQPNGNFISRFIKPWVYADYWTLRQLVPSEDSNVAHPPEVAEGFNPYWPSSVTKTPPLLWIPRDPAGVSKLEITETSKIIPITDEGCILDEENRLVWDTVKARPPIWEAKVLY